MKKIVLVDDEKNILEAYRRNLMGEFDLITSESGEAAVEIFKKNPRIPVIVTDYKMPGMNGVELLKKIKEIAPETVQIMLTGQAEMNAVINLINRAKIFRFLTKPCTPEDLTNSINDALRQHELVTAEKELLGKTLGGSIKVLVDLLALAKPQAFAKTRVIRSLSKKIFQHINGTSSWQMEIAATLSQIGTVIIPDDTLKKSYRGITLSDDETVMFNNHPLIGADMIKNIPRLDAVAEIIKYQLKNYDGTGSPEDAVSGEVIPLGSRILRIVTDFDNLTDKGISKDEALEEIKRKPSWYDLSLLQKASHILLDLPADSEDPMTLELGVDELQEGMILAENITAADGTIIAEKNLHLTAPLISAITNLSRSGQLNNPVKVIITVD